MFNTSVKTLAAAAVLIAAGSSAFASDHIFADRSQDLTSFVELDLVRASTDGVVDIYELTADGQGKLLGSQAVHAGANQDVRVSFNTITNQDVIAVLTTNGSVAATQDIDASVN
ncbi:MULTISPECIES: hypothetical protein [Pacificibacter]|uniref:hypothetical protein n=1 Tax=Pacificibacter TaxID=1042323 RepID=UPI001C086D3E|nr:MULTISPECIES: hypothetical protein [Pacificibacter]MBU2936962.1 hypothetical protein [Pacificibacter marinus]MDO6614958.1 hypothetical protein [Pacificibacter sp. 1_MG-2023]